MAVTAYIAGEQGGGASTAYAWSVSYEDTTRRVTAEGSGAGNVTVVVQITTAGGTSTIQFVQPGRTADVGVDYPVTMGAGPTLIGPSINPNQVARIVGKIGQATGGLPFTESWSRT